MTHDIEKLRSAALAYHEFPHPGKTETVPTKPFSTPADLSLAYSPGVAYPSLEIADNPSKVFDYTNKGNTVAVISNGTAVLGIGDVGALAAKPVMEGKALLFKIFANIDAYDIEISEKDPKKMIETVRAIAPSFGGINLEDIRSPECFEIEAGLATSCGIPVMHDDQHGTAVIVAAAMINAADIQDKKIDEIKLVVNGAGAAAIACTRLLIRLGVRPDNIVMCDSKGVMTRGRDNLNAIKREFVTDRDDLHTLADALKGADAFLGLSVADVMTPAMLRSMAPRPIVFALANPDPEIDRATAMATRDDLVYATGRSDYPNQINNVLGFPYIFRGALDCRARCINEDMKLAAARAIAHIARQPVPDELAAMYGVDSLRFGPGYILPKPFDRRLLSVVSPAVAVAAMNSGVAARHIADPDKYGRTLEAEIHCMDNAMNTFISYSCAAPSLK